MRIGITGATGGVGRAACRTALGLGHEVTALVRDPARATELRAMGVELVKGDLEDAAALERTAAGAGAFIHGAAHVGDVGTREEFERTNVGGTRRAIDAAARAGVKRFVHVSSSAVYGRPSQGNIDEDHPLRPFGLPYEDTKLAAERLAFTRGAELGIEVCAVRPCIVFGPEDRVFIPRAVAALRARRALLINRGRAPLNVVSSEDVADVLLRGATHPAAAGEAFNVASSPPPTVKEVFDTIADAAFLPRTRISLPYAVALPLARVVEAIWKLTMRPGPPPVTPFVVTLLTRNVVYDASKARRVLGWEGGKDPLGGIRKVVAQMRVGS